MTVDALVALLSTLTEEQRQYEVFFRALDGHPRYIMRFETMSGTRSVTNGESNQTYLENRVVFSS